ncbi:hypothetical protein B7494_g3727 [Chlorociboria aeruginascens]|nr:hypothetical protein B7494_g3727 [Chlorociboria aeruginascens]
MATTHTPLLHDSSSILTSSTYDRSTQSKNREFIRYTSFLSAMLSCLCAGSITAFSLYGHIFLERLHWTQLGVNSVIIGAELALYLPALSVGYLCDRIGPAPISFASAILFGVGYLLAAFTYKNGATDAYGNTPEHPWPLAIMVFAFVIIGGGTVCMYMSAVSTCAKNFGKGKYRGLALACPVAAFGLSGMWQSQIGSRVLYETLPGGRRGDVDVFKYFVFLAIILLVAGLLGAVVLKVVDEDELIDEAVEELERSGLLEDSVFFRRGYGSIEAEIDGDESRQSDEAKALEDEEARKKRLLLNEETKRFLKDHTMWYLAAGFFFVSGPGENFITNLGTIIGTLYPPLIDPTVIPTTPATHVSIVAITSTVSRIFFGIVTDLLAPTSTGHHYQSASNSLSSLPHPRKSYSVSRITFLLLSGLLILLGQVLLASGLIQNHAERFWIISTLIGSGYGAIFSLTPLIITIIWGVENFGTNWGIVAMMPALGATVWGVVYAKIYQWAATKSVYGELMGQDLMCYGKQCYEITSALIWLSPPETTMADTLSSNGFIAPIVLIRLCAKAMSLKTAINSDPSNQSILDFTCLDTIHDIQNIVREIFVTRARSLLDAWLDQINTNLSINPYEDAESYSGFSWDVFAKLCIGISGIRIILGSDLYRPDQDPWATYVSYKNQFEEFYDCFVEMFHSAVSHSNGAKYNMYAGIIHKTISTDIEPIQEMMPEDKRRWVVNCMAHEEGISTLFKIKFDETFGDIERSRDLGYRGLEERFILLYPMLLAKLIKIPELSAAETPQPTGSLYEEREKLRQRIADAEDWDLTPYMASMASTAVKGYVKNAKPSGNARPAQRTRQAGSSTETAPRTLLPQGTSNPGSKREVKPSRKIRENSSEGAASFLKRVPRS